MVHLAGISFALPAHPLPPALEPSGVWTRTIYLGRLLWAKSPFSRIQPQTGHFRSHSSIYLLIEWEAHSRVPYLHCIKKEALARLSITDLHCPLIDAWKKTASCILFTCLQLFSEDTPGIRCSILARCRSLHRAVHPHRFKCKPPFASSNSHI